MSVDFGQECFTSLPLDLSQHKFLSLDLGHLLCLFNQLKLRLVTFDNLHLKPCYLNFSNTPSIRGVGLKPIRLTLRFKMFSNIRGELGFVCASIMFRWLKYDRLYL